MVVSCYAVLLGACSSKPVAVPANLTVGASASRAMPSPVVAAPDARPHILAIRFSTLTIRPGTWFDGTMICSTNVASVEVRTAAFSINSAHVAPGVYRFHTRVLELPPLSRRHWYELDIIARNTAGVEEIERAPLRVE